MSLRNAMNAGVSGLTTEGSALGVVGDNVANINTVGFKRSRSVFETVLGGAVGRPDAPGQGVRMTRTQQIFAQGALLTTGQPTDLALSGDGFFVVQGALDGVPGTFYTRAGQASVNNQGALVNPQGLALQGYAANGDGTFASSPSALSIPAGGIPPRATTRLTVGANLDASAATPTAPWDPNNPAATSNFSTAMTVYDSQGGAHTVSVYFRRTGANAWEYHALANGGEVAGGTAGRNSEVATGTLTFSTSGALQAQASTGGGTVSFNGARPGQALAFNFGTPAGSGGTGLDGITQFGSASNVSAQSQDGYAAGSLSSVRVDGDGTVNGVYTNGQTLPVGRLAVARFRANEGLGRAGHNLWASTLESGEAAVGAAGAGGRASVVSGALEQSNVDVSEQFVDLIAHQRAFQANSKTITTADQMLQEIMNLNR
jgi:flagellar hook protein FlgE